MGNFSDLFVHGFDYSISTKLFFKLHLNIAFSSMIADQTNLKHSLEFVLERLQTLNSEFA